MAGFSKFGAHGVIRGACAGMGTGPCHRHRTTFVARIFSDICCTYLDGLYCVKANLGCASIERRYGLHQLMRLGFER